MCGNSAHISRRFTKSANVNNRNPLVPPGRRARSVRKTSLGNYKNSYSRITNCHDRRHRAVRRRASGQSALYSVLPAHFPSRRLSTLFFPLLIACPEFHRPTCLPALWMGMSPKHNATTKPTALLSRSLLKLFRAWFA